MDCDLRWFAGIDWGSDQHAACVVDPQGSLIRERFFRHSVDGLADLANWLTEASQGCPSALGVGIEVPRGAIVETLVERGFAVHSLNPKQLDRFRDRHTVAGAKDDRRDAFVLADSLRTDLHAFRRIRLDDPGTVQLRELVRTSGELKEEQVRLANRLRELLLRITPHLLALSAAADDPWLWALLAEAPSLERLQRLSLAKISRILRDHRIRRVTSEQAAACLREPALPVAPGVVSAVWGHISLLLPRLQLVHAQLHTCERHIQQLLTATDTEQGQEHEHRDAEIILSLPGVGMVVAATMLAEAGQAIADRDYHSLRAHCGVAPVTHQSGKRKLVSMRRACKTRLRDAVYHMARIAAQRDPTAKAYYDGLRARGHGHARALRSVADRHLRIMTAALTSGTLYQPPSATLVSACA